MTILHYVLTIALAVSVSLVVTLSFLLLSEDPERVAEELARVLPERWWTR